MTNYFFKNVYLITVSFPPQIGLNSVCISVSYGYLIFLLEVNRVSYEFRVVYDFLRIFLLLIISFIYSISNFYITGGVSSEEVEKNTINEDMKNSGSMSGEPQTSCETPDSRPLSDASGYSDDQLSVKLRSKSTSNLQRPLTRYLPIKSETLNLRSHIETAGHQVDLCTHVRLDSTSCRGYLSKMGSRFRTWRKRWFVFDRVSRTFSYYADSLEKKRRGGTNFEAIEEVYVDHLNSFKSPNPKVTFVVKSNSRSYHLIAPSPEAMRIWVDVIFTGAEGYQQYSQH